MDDSDRLSALRAELVKRMGRDRYELWLGPQTKLELSSHALRVGCTSTFELQCVRRHSHASLLESCRCLLGEQVPIEYFVQADETATTMPAAPKYVQQSLLDGENGATDLPESVNELSLEKSPAMPVTLKPVPVPVEKKQPRSAGSMMARSTFASFVSGPSNELAYRTAKTVAERIGHYGPLFLYGPPGIGKTHLLYAIVQHLRKNAASLRTLRMTSEQFTTEFLDALQHRTSASFRHKYRSVDVLLIDDIQFLARKRATLEELLVTIDSLHERGKQVVLTCDSSPQELLKLSSELASRISGGLAVPLEMPDFATRQALVRKFIAEMHPVIGMAIDDEIVVVIATQVAGSARQLRGAINRLIVTGEALRKPLTADVARTILAEYMQQITPTVRLPDIQRAICEVFGVEASSLKSPSKTRSVAEPRMLAMWLACNLTRSALGEISEFFGRRSHSTVISAQKKIERMVSQGETIAVANQPCSVEEAIRKVQRALRSA